MAHKYNEQEIYAAYTSGSYRNFFQTEEEAEAHCQKSGSGAEFNGEWFQDRYTHFPPRSLVIENKNEEILYANNLNGTGIGKWQVPFVKWVD